MYQNKPISFSSWFQSTVATTLLIFSLALTGHADSGIQVSVDSSGIMASETVSATRMTLRVGGPGGIIGEERSQGGFVSWNLPGGAPDGTYHYDVYVSTGATDDDRDGNGNGQHYRESGSFTVKGGTMTVPAVPLSNDVQGKRMPEGPSWLSRLAMAVLDVLVPPAHAVDLFINDTTPALLFDDINDEDFTADWDWSIDTEGGSNDADTNNTFEIRGWTESLPGLPVPIIRLNHDGGFDPVLDSIDTLVADFNGDIRFASDSMFIDRNLNQVGIGTITPAESLHIVNPNTPGILLDDTGNGVWRITEIGNDLAFIDVNDGIESLTLDGIGGRIGMGTFTPAAKLHVRVNSNTFELPMVVENVGSDNFVGFRLQTALGFIDFNNSNQEFRLNIEGSTAGPEFRLNAGGNLTIKGTLTQGSSRSIKTDIVSVDGQTVLDKLALLDMATWRYKSDDGGTTHLGPMAEDFSASFGLGGDDKYIAPADMAGVALASVKSLNEKLKTSLQAQKAQHDLEIRELKTQNKKLSNKLEQLEAIVTSLVK